MAVRTPFAGTDLTPQGQRLENEEENGQSVSPWDQRYHRFQRLYNELAFSPQLVEALADGLRAWADLLPQSEVDEEQRYTAANEWGLAPELTQLPNVVTALRLRGWGAMADDFKTAARELRMAAGDLDRCYPTRTKSLRAAEARITATARGMALRLAELLLAMIPQLFGSDPLWPRREDAAAGPGQRAARRPVPKRASRAAAIEAVRKELTEFIRSSADHMRAAAVSGKHPMPLPRPTMRELGERAGLPAYTVSRCLGDPAAPELKMLWNLAADGEQTLRYARR